jgi:hypothetical protein
MAFSAVQKHFEDFRTLRFEVEQRMNGESLMKARVAVREDGSVRTEVGDVVVVVNMAEKRVMTLFPPQRMAVISPLEGNVSREESTKWLDEVREFQGVARLLPETRLIRGVPARGWELPLAEGNVVLWADATGLPMEMQLNQGVAIDMSFKFEFDPELSADLFKTELPAGYKLGEEEN